MINYQSLYRVLPLYILLIHSSSVIYKNACNSSISILLVLGLTKGHNLLPLTRASPKHHKLELRSARDMLTSSNYCLIPCNITMAFIQHSHHLSLPQDQVPSRIKHILEIGGSVRRDSPRRDSQGTSPICNTRVTPITTSSSLK